MSETLPLPSEHLKSKKWRPIRPDVHPQDTGWIDPINGKVLTFGEASVLQYQRDAEREK